MCVVLKTDGIIILATKLIINLHTISLDYFSWNTSIGEIFYHILDCKAADSIPYRRSVGAYEIIFVTFL